MAAPDPDGIEVAFALPGQQWVLRVAHRPGLTAEEAVRSSGMLEQRPELAARPLLLGIFGRRIAASEVLQPGDRVEIYRPLKADPRAARRAATRRSRGTRTTD